MTQKITALRKRHAWFDRTLDVHERITEINGGFIASGLTVAIFISIFPLLLVAIAIVGFLASGDDQLAGRVVENLGLTGSAADTMTTAIERASSSRQAASVVGLVGLAWTGSGVAGALQLTIRAPWQERGEGLRGRAVGMVLLAGAAVGFAAALALGGLLNFLPDGPLALLVTPLAIALGITAQFGLFLWLFWGFGSRRVPWRDLVPGAVVAAVGFEVLKLVGTVYVPQLVARSSALYGPLGIVFAVLAWLAFFSRLVVYSAALNAVRYEAREGSEIVSVHLPKLPGRPAVAATRSGARLEAEDPDPTVPGHP